MCRILRITGFTLGFTWILMGLGPAAQAQTPEPSKQAFNPLGDPSRFTKMGGWGGFGGMIGQFGLSKAMLVTNPAVHEELKLTKEQKEDLKDWEEAMRKRGENMFRNGGANPQAPPQPSEVPNGGPPAGFNPLGMMDMITSLVQEGETSLAKILTKKQYTRLNQIALQMEGVAALGREDVAEAIFLSPVQVEDIKQILSENKTKQMGFMMGQAFAMRRNRGQGPDQAQPKASPANDATASKSATKKATPTPAAADEDPEVAQEKRRAAARERMQGQFTKMRDGTDEIQNATVSKILKVLTKKQEVRFEKLLGPPFDPSKFTFPGAPQRPPGTTTASDPAAKKAATPTPVRSSRLRDSRGTSTPGSDDK